MSIKEVKPVTADASVGLTENDIERLQGEDEDTFCVYYPHRGGDPQQLNFS